MFYIIYVNKRLASSMITIYNFWSIYEIKIIGFKPSNLQDILVHTWMSTSMISSTITVKSFVTSFTTTNRVPIVQSLVKQLVSTSLL